MTAAVKKCSWKTFWPACSTLVKNLNFHFLQQIGEQPFAAEKKKSGKANADFCLREFFFFFCFTTKVRIFPLHPGMPVVAIAVGVTEFQVRIAFCFCRICGFVVFSDGVK